MSGKSTLETAAGVSTPQDIARIRDILLGPQMREYEQRFALVQRDLERLQSLADQLTEHLQEQAAAHPRRTSSTTTGTRSTTRKCVILRARAAR